MNKLTISILDELYFNNKVQIACRNLFAKKIDGMISGLSLLKKRLYLSGSDIVEMSKSPNLYFQLKIKGLVHKSFRKCPYSLKTKVYKSLLKTLSEMDIMEVSELLC